MRRPGQCACASWPKYFAQWLLYFASSIKVGTLSWPFGTGKHVPVAAEDQSRVIVAILEDPAPQRGKVCPRHGPKECTHAEFAHVPSRVLGREVRYKQVTVEELQRKAASGLPLAPGKVTAPTMCREPEQLQRGELKESFVVQQIREVAVDHQAGVLIGTNEVIEANGGRPPMWLEAFMEMPL